MKSLLQVKELKSSIFLLFFLACFSICFSQSPLEKMVNENGNAEMSVSIEKARISSTEFDAYVKDYVLFDIDKDAARLIKNLSPKTLELEIPTTEGNFTLKLVQQSIVSPDYRVESSSGTVTIEKELGVHYRGIIKGERGSIAGASFFDGKLSILASSKSLGNFTINQLENENDQRYISYFDKDLKIEGGFECHTEEPDVIPEFLQNQRLQESVEVRGGGPCVRIHIEADNGFVSK